MMEAGTASETLDANWFCIVIAPENVIARNMFVVTDLESGKG